jgi:hypothetical protein
MKFKKSFLLNMSKSMFLLLTIFNLFAQTGYSAPGGSWQPATKSCNGVNVLAVVNSYDFYAWQVAYQSRGINGQIADPSYAYVYTDPAANEKYTASEWMLSKQNLILLPVLVNKFSAVRDNNDVKLDWTTSNEVNSDRSIIERSTDGSRFSSLKEIEAAGNSNTEIRYSHLDASLPTSTYVFYRLSQRDKNGKVQIMGIKKVYLGSQGYEIALYPTVVSGTVNIEIQGSVNDQITVQIVDMAGRQSSQYVIAPRQNLLAVNTDKLSKGMYIIQVSGRGKNQTSKFDKQWTNRVYMLPAGSPPGLFMS